MVVIKASVGAVPAASASFADYLVVVALRQSARAAMIVSPVLLN